MTNGERFEKKFLEVIMRFMAERELTQKYVAARAWPGQAKPDNMWKRLRGGQKLTLCDAYQLSMAVGYDFEDFVAKVIRQMKSERSDPPTESSAGGGT
jgi:hypothetical protein